MADDSSDSGRVLSGRYRLEHQLGGGGMGAIWRAEHLVLRAPVAVKLLDAEIAADEQAIARFNREAQAAASLRSPHVVQIIDYGVDEGAPFIVMELLEGETLADRIKSAGRLSPAETSRIITHVARAVARAHEAGVVHRDLKPENVFLVHNEDAEIAKVLDFGVAKVDAGKLGGSAMTRTGSLLGTPYYMSPEQAQGNKEVDHRSDLWALGVIAYECLTGERPFDSDGLGDLVLSICVRDIPVPSSVASVPPGFDAWFAKAVSRDPELRFQSARELADTLRESLGVEARETIDTLSDVAPSVPKLRRASAAGPGPEAPTPRNDAIAATIAAAPSDTAPVRQAAAPKAKTSTLLWVAGGALLVGLVGGLAVLATGGGGAQVEDRPLPDGAAVAAVARPDAAAGPVAHHHGAGHAAQSADEPAADAAATVVRDASTHDASARDASTPDAGAAAAGKHDGGALDAPHPRKEAGAGVAPTASALPPPLPIPLPDPSGAP